MASDDKIIDWRSTGRRKARRTLYNQNMEFKCQDCNKTTKEPPKDAPKHFEDLWPLEKRVLNSRSLQADHVDKDVTNNAIENVTWRCASCHKLADMQSDVGISQTRDEIFKMM